MVLKEKTSTRFLLCSFLVVLFVLCAESITEVASGGKPLLTLLWSDLLNPSVP